MFKESKKFTIQYSTSVEVNGILYFSAHYMNGLFKLDLLTKEIEYIGRCSEESKSVDLYRYALAYRGKVYFIPGVGNYIVCIDTMTGKIERYKVPEAEHTCGDYKFAAVVEVNGEVWMIPAQYDAILRLNMDTNEMERYSNWPKEIAEKVGKGFLFSDGIHIDNHIYLCPRDVDYFVIFDIVTKEMKLWKWENELWFNDLHYCNEALWFVSHRNNGCIMKYSFISKELQCVHKISEKLREDKREIRNPQLAYGASILIGDRIFCAPYLLDYWLVIDTSKGKVEKIAFEKGETLERDQPLYINKLQTCGENILVVSTEYETALVFSPKLEIENVFSLTMTDEIRAAWREDLFRKIDLEERCNITEIPLTEFIEWMTQMNHN